MPLQKLQFRPGVIRDVTGYTNEGGWRDSNLVRFRLGFPESIGGWTKYNADSTFLGTCRALFNWVALDGSYYLAVGTNIKYYIELGGTFFDITPIRKTSVLNGPFTATTGSPTITVAAADHGGGTGDYVTFSGATSLGGNMTATVLNQEYVITVVDANTFTITASVNATSADTGHGGTTVTAAYQISVGVDTQINGTGWGVGPWGETGWGLATTYTSLRIWTQDNYGEDLLYTIRNGNIYYWDATTGVSVRGVALSSLSTDPTTPTIALQTLVSERDRHVICFGSNAGTGTVQDPLSIRFSSQEDPFTWSPTATNTAGELRLGSGTKIVRALETKREIVIFTDSAIHSMQYLGPPYTFGVQQLATGITIAGFNSAVAVDDSVFWMGNSNFYVYAGRTDPLTCPVQHYVFDDFNSSQSDKVFAYLNSQYSEVTWLYPSGDSEDCDRYVTYNYVDKAWTFGNMSRTAWLDKGVSNLPIAAAKDQYLYFQEVGTDDGSTNPPSALTPYIESSPIDIGEGEKFSFVRRIIPDINFYASTNNPTATMVLKTQNYPGSTYRAGSSSEVVRTTTVPVDQYTTVSDIRLRGRSLVFRLESAKVGTGWGLGSPRIEVRPDGTR